ncbi:MAG TPA: hypothetical protein EYP17_01550 [Candidatus Latescibacteria bacterium]|nr:hypothetical protein [Candidatus Latescibacterota bacterium]
MRLSAMAGLLWAVSAWGELAHLPGAFGEMGFGARASGLGGACVVLVEGPDAALWNPAGLVGLRGREFLFSTTRQFGLVPCHTLLYGDQVLGYPVALGLRTAGDAALQEHTLLFSGAGILRGEVTSGVTAKVYYATFGGNPEGSWVTGGVDRQVKGSAWGFGLDVGLRGQLGGRLAWGVVVRDLLSWVQYDARNQAGTAEGGREAVPARVWLGLGFWAGGGTLFEVDIRKALYRDQRDRVFFGVERWAFGRIALRGGMAQDLEVEHNRTLSAGFGMNFQAGSVPVGVDVAYVSTELGDSFHFSLRWTGGK